MTSTTLLKRFRALPVKERVEFRLALKKEKTTYEEEFFANEGMTVEEFDAEMRRRMKGKSIPAEQVEKDLDAYIRKLKSEKAGKVSR